MKFKLILVGISVVLVSLVLCGVVYAPWTTLGTGYAITSNVHGINILPGTPVTVTAGTLDPDVTHVKFVWRQPPDGNGPVRWEVVVPVSPNGTMGEWNNGTAAPILYAQDTQMPDVAGDWGVHAIFQDSADYDVPANEHIAKKSTSFNVVQHNVVPEIPLGTVGAAVAMAIALGLFAMKKKKST